MKVLGIDPSLTAPGFCWGVDQYQTETVHTNVKHGDGRLGTIRDATRHHLRSGINLAMIEGPGFASDKGVTLGMVQGVIRLTLTDHAVPYVVVPPATLKLFATGYGDATKDAMADAMEEKAGWRANDDNAVDAWWLTVMGFMPAVLLEGVVLPDHRLRAVSAVSWHTAGIDAWPFRIDPKTVIDNKPCLHGYRVARDTGLWLHPFTAELCDKPPKQKARTR